MTAEGAVPPGSPGRVTRAFEEGVFLPAGVAALVSLAAALGLARADRYLSAFGATGAPEAALPILTAVLVAGVVLIVVEAAVAALLAGALRARPPHGASLPLALSVAAIVFALVGLGAVRLPLVDTMPFAPPLVTTAAAALLLVAIAAFVRRLQRLGRWAASGRAAPTRTTAPPRAVGSVTIGALMPGGTPSEGTRPPAPPPPTPTPHFRDYPVAVEDAEPDGAREERV